MAETAPLPLPSGPEGRLADNIVHFARALRRAGMGVGPASVVDAVEAVLAAGIGTREDFYWTLHAALVKRREDRALFNEAFRLFWRSRALLEEMLAAHAAGSGERPARPAESRAAAAMLAGGSQGPEAQRAELEARFAASPRDALGSKDFAQMSAEELAEARRAIAKLALTADLVRTRRFRADPRGRKLDPRATMRGALRTGGALILPKLRSPRRARPPIVVLADISGSMSRYSRIFLHFCHALTASGRRVHSFAFGTRLTNLTRQMRHRDPDEALAEAAAAVADWSGGTRIGEAIGTFNRKWSRRVLGQGATVLLMTDGLERDELDRLAREMERLQRSCRRLVWLNPLLRFDGFEPRAGGVRIMLPRVDEFRPVHSLDALAELCVALSEPSASRRGLARSERYGHMYRQGEAS